MKVLSEGLEKYLLREIDYHVVFSDSQSNVEDALRDLNLEPEIIEEFLKSQAIYKVPPVRAVVHGNLHLHEITSKLLTLAY